MFTVCTLKLFWYIVLDASSNLYYFLYRSALEKKKADENKNYQAIDYDAPIESDKSTIGFGTRVSIYYKMVLHFHNLLASLSYTNKKFPSRLELA